MRIQIGQSVRRSRSAGGVDETRAVDPGAADSTVVYEAQFFDQFNPITASDMLDRIPGVNVFGGSRDGRRSRSSTGGNMLINGQRIAGKDNSPGTSWIASLRQKFSASKSFVIPPASWASVAPGR